MTCKVCKKLVGIWKLFSVLFLKNQKNWMIFFPSKLAGSVTLKKGENREILPDFFPLFFSIFSDIFFFVKIWRTVKLEQLKNSEKNQKKKILKFLPIYEFRELFSSRFFDFFCHVDNIKNLKHFFKIEYALLFQTWSQCT